MFSDGTIDMYTTTSDEETKQEEIPQRTSQVHGDPMYMDDPNTDDHDYGDESLRLWLEARTANAARNGLVVLMTPLLPLVMTSLLLMTTMTLMTTMRKLRIVTLKVLWRTRLMQMRNTIHLQQRPIAQWEKKLQWKKTGHQNT